MFRTIFQLCGNILLLASVANAQSQPSRNIFFGFEFVLSPIAVKWSCGGDRAEDLIVFEALIEAFPGDAEAAGLSAEIERTLQALERGGGLSVIFGKHLSGEQEAQICDAAEALSVDWATPEHLKSGGEGGMSAAQSAAWDEFWQVIERSS
ncbi:hypothetical protein [Planktotalea frisia]|uniref:hypothetical protein n=1 Tax=Planktotalea frisia TaxID=696762 RepID=UPI002352617E|nr:hypothetical protein [Planktotalea frisia]